MGARWDGVVIGYDWTPMLLGPGARFERGRMMRRAGSRDRNRTSEGELREYTRHGRRRPHRIATLGAIVEVADAARERASQRSGRGPRTSRPNESQSGAVPRARCDDGGREEQASCIEPEKCSRTELVPRNSLTARRPPRPLSHLVSVRNPVAGLRLRRQVRSISAARFRKISSCFR